MIKSLVSYPDKCTGCHRCEMWCALTKENSHNPVHARVHILRREPGLDVPVVCLHCGICLSACMFDAISRNRKTGAVEIDQEKCTGCARCLLACPYGMIHMDTTKRRAAKCDLCGGSPACVEHCKEGALAFVEADEVARERREPYARSLGRRIRGGEATNLRVD